MGKAFYIFFSLSLRPTVSPPHFLSSSPSPHLTAHSLSPSPSLHLSALSLTDRRLPTYHCPPTNWRHWSIFSSLSHSPWVQRQSWIFGGYPMLFVSWDFFFCFFWFLIRVCGYFSSLSNLDFCLMVVVFWVVSGGFMVGCNFGGCFLNGLWCFDGCFLSCWWWFGGWWCFGDRFFLPMWSFGWWVGWFVNLVGLKKYEKKISIIFSIKHSKMKIYYRKYFTFANILHRNRNKGSVCQ